MLFTLTSRLVTVTPCRCDRVSPMFCRPPPGCGASGHWRTTAVYRLAHRGSSQALFLSSFIINKHIKVRGNFIKKIM